MLKTKSASMADFVLLFYHNPVMAKEEVPLLNVCGAREAGCFAGISHVAAEDKPPLRLRQYKTPIQTAGNFSK
ncbi:MAG: hypothetical protein Q7K39_03575 [Candidatus Magasanikbacteria bacterium]|nr:hypothetical protein [Candidatus Magasanikbacteria bacterium]